MKPEHRPERPASGLLAHPAAPGRPRRLDTPPADQPNPWRTLRRSPVYENPWIAVVAHDVLTPRGDPGVYGVVHRKHQTVGVLAVDEEGCIVLVGQYRYGVQAYSWEIVEGGGPLGDDPLAAAGRELREEAGLAAAAWLPILAMDPSNSVTDERVTCFLAWDLEAVPAEPDGTEELEVVRVPFARALGMALSGAIRDGITIAALLRVELMALQGDLPAPVARSLARGRYPAAA